MSESLYLQRQSERFLAAHPREAGWVVHQIHGDSGREMSLNYLLDCLREWHPSAVTRRLAFPLVAAGAFRNWTHTHTLSNSDVMNGASEEVDAYSWRGTIGLVWNGHDIHCHKLSLAVDNGLEEIYFVATKSVAAFRDLLLVLDRYGKARHKGKTEEIYVVNGDNISISPISWDEVVLPANMVRGIKMNVDGFLPDGSATRTWAFRTVEDFCLPGRQVAGKR